MRFDPIYERYRDGLIDLITQLNEIEHSHKTIADEERNAVSEIENRFTAASEELQAAEETIRAQYKSVRTSCEGEGIIRPREQRPAPTELSWREAVKQQEQVASQIREWFAEKTRKAVLEKEKKLREQAARDAAIAAVQAEAERRRAEEKAILERLRAEELVEELKRKHKKR